MSLATDSEQQAPLVDFDRSKTVDECANHCIVVVGASAGGVDALQRLVEDLPLHFPAAMFIVLHVGERSYLTNILGRVASLPVENATSGKPIEMGRIYVAPPGAHLLLHDSHILLRRGPRENLARPSIDPLFRSAACSFGARVIGVVLSGSLSDGTAGLRAIKDCGEISIIQHPDDAAFPDMVLSAMRHTDIDYCVPLSEMTDLLVRLANEAAGDSPKVPLRIRLEAAIAAQENATMATEDRLGDLSVFVCPECHGPLWEIEDGPLLRFRCHTGHAFTGDVMLEAQATEAEQILWSLLRAHQQRAALARRMASDERAKNRTELAERLSRRAKDYEADAELVQQIIRNQEIGVSNVSAMAATGGNGAA